MKNNTSTQYVIGQLVQGIRAGHFEILGFREIGGEAYAQLKPIDKYGNEWVRLSGEIALPISAIKPF